MGGGWSALTADVSGVEGAVKEWLEGGQRLNLSSGCLAESLLDHAAELTVLAVTER